ncbi:MAG: cupin domain-containing protein [Selenomonadaceae bacterium]|nr:cupin domain-containing protein [Selenomonadaceae bacterium]
MTGDFAKFFSGKTYLNHLVPRGGAVINMTFEPGCRSNWHIHHNGGQVLLVTGGAGWYQEEGKEPRPLRPGDVVRVPAEIKHWHGAAKDSWMSHLLVPIAVPGASNAFLEAVEDKEYDALPPSREDGADDSLMSHLGAKLFGKQ